jgi:multidrug efflux pump subunit AcrA (membrane-fusion protein)
MTSEQQQQETTPDLVRQAERAPALEPEPGHEHAGPGAQRRSRTVRAPQVLSAVVIAAACLLAVLWYVPGIIRTDSQSFTGTVVSNGITNLNFANAGVVSRIRVSLGQVVKSGQVLATQSTVSSEAITADRASIVLAQTALARDQATGAPATSTAAAQAQLARAQAQLATDKATLNQAQVMAPSAGTVIAINAQPGETVTSAGVRTYSGAAQGPSGGSPPFSLLPQGPGNTLKTSGGQQALPVIALRTSDSWEVVALIPEDRIGSVSAGQSAIVSVPALRLRLIRGVVRQVSPTPVSTAQGTAYQVTVTVTGKRKLNPLNGMTADVQIMGS